MNHTTNQTIAAADFDTAHRLMLNRVHELPSFKREEKPLNTGHNHVCADAQLGEFVRHEVFNAACSNEPADWQVIFYYQHGCVMMHVDQNNYKYARVLGATAAAA